MTGQISMFDMLDEYETPEIPPEDQKKGTKGWIIECSGIFLMKDGMDRCTGSSGGVHPGRIA